MNRSRTLIVGAGLMGTGIAQVVATAGFQVTLVDVTESVLDRSVASIRKRLTRATEGGPLTIAEAEAAMSQIATSIDLDTAAVEADHVIEAIPEDLSMKLELFARLDGLCPPDVILTTNTSQYSITRIAAATTSPQRVIGTHWFNPPPVLDLIEIVRGAQTTDATLQGALDRAKAYGKQAVVCQRDTAGFITTRLIVGLMVEAMRLVEEGVASVEDINVACVNAFGHRMGPLDTADLTGLDTILRISDELRDQFGERFLPTQGLRALVAAGHHGRKTGRGFRRYD
jgi:3-hydroxybutyryl-CoA dehydrogenase